MSRLLAALLLSLSLFSGEGGLSGFGLGITPVNVHMFAALAGVPDKAKERDNGSGPARPCCQMACTHTLFVPERYAFVGHVLKPLRLLPSSDLGLRSTALQRDPPVPRILIG